MLPHEMEPQPATPELPPSPLPVIPPSLSAPRPRTRWSWRRRLLLGLLLIPMACAGILVPFVQDAREAARQSNCKCRLCVIGLALQNYHDDYGSFPPAIVAGERGKPMHSWRVLLLPYMDQNELYAAYRFDEPWDGPNNRQLHGAFLEAYHCPSSPVRKDFPCTSYVAVVGTETIWPGLECSRLLPSLSPSEFIT
ncbi:MAG: DUF1559 domain-containing protein [Planctomycetales bacterium]